jgi:TIR domain
MPAFKYSCFISYRHGQGHIKQRFMEEFHHALSDELELLRSQRVFVDKDRLQGGDFYNEALARSVYESATQIVVYQPDYFDVLHPYCAREYRAMRSLEIERLALLRDSGDGQHGLIIPVVLRGVERIPAELKGLRQHEDFSRFMLMDVELNKHPEYAPRIRRIAEYIDARCNALEAADIAFLAAGEFQFPDEEATLDWIRELGLSKIGFPGAGKA